MKRNWFALSWRKALQRNCFAPSPPNCSRKQVSIFADLAANNLGERAGVRGLEQETNL